MTAPQGRGEPEILIFDDPDALAAEAASRVASALSVATEENGTAHFALTGGSSPVALYRLLAARADVPWERVHLWWGDDRLVPAEHPESNFGLVRDTLLRADAETVHGAAVPAPNVHPFPIAEGLAEGRTPEWIAQAYAQEVERHVRSVEGRPRFDVMLLGVGPDGHIMSAFPKGPAIVPDAPLALAVPAPTAAEPHLPRLTLRAHVADDAATLLVLVPDGSKAAVVARILEGQRDEADLPAQVARRAGATWLLTEASAQALARSGA